VSKETKKRSVVKTITWRILATLTTMLLVYIFSSNLGLAASIGAVEIIVKLIFYYVHERVWQLAKNDKKRLNAFLKSISWRVLASLITIGLVFSFGIKFGTASIIGSIELVIKLVIYYLHEELWIRITWGYKDRKEN